MRTLILDRMVVYKYKFNMDPNFWSNGRALKKE